MPATIKIKNSSTAGAAPTSSDLVQGELAVNVTDKRLFTENSGGTIVELGTNPSIPVTFPDGSASAPSLTNDGDTNTGMFFPAADTVGIATGGTERARVDSSGNLGLGVTPSAWASGVKGLQVGANSYASAVDLNNGVTAWGSNYYNDGANKFAYSSGRYALQLLQDTTSGAQSFRVSTATGSAGGTVSWTTAMTLDASGNLGVGTTTLTNSKFTVAGFNGNMRFAGYSGVSDNGITSNIYYNGSSWVNDTGSYGASAVMFTASASAITFNTTASTNTFPTERARIDSSGNLLVGTTGVTGSKLVVKSDSSATALLLRGSTDQRLLQVVDGTTSGSPSGTSAIAYLERFSSNSRSLNAAGSLNASGADYAEYMTKAGDFTVAKGDVVGINADGKLTNVFADAVTFVVKSTDPSYVGNDTWGVGFEGNQEGLEAARQLVDRIAFAGQVPVNVTGATAGQYIVPVNDNGTIKGQAVSTPTFEQYQQAVGKVIAIEQDGRARIIVKVA